MRSDPVRLPGGFLLSGKISISCENSSFGLNFNSERITLDANSFSSLLRLKKEAESILSQAEGLIPLPNEKKDSRPSMIIGEGILVTVKGRPVGNIVESHAGVRFRPTPLQFLKNLF